MRKFKKLLIGLTAVVGSAFAINAAGASGFQPAKAGYYSESDTYYHVTSESDFRDNFWNYSNLMFEDNLDFIANYQIKNKKC